MVQSIPDTEEMYEAREKLRRMLTGAMSTRRTTPAPIRRGPAPPSWWTDDDEATDDNFRAMTEMQPRG